MSFIIIACAMLRYAVIMNSITNIATVYIYLKVAIHVMITAYFNTVLIMNDML